MFNEIKTSEEYLRCICEKRSAYWGMLLELERDGLKDSPDYHRAISAWAAYDSAICLFEELMDNLREKDPAI